MPPTPDNCITTQLSAIVEGDSDAVGRLMPLVYDELRALAARSFGRAGQNTMDPTALVHELFLRLSPTTEAPAMPKRIESRAHFMAIAATAMRQILANHIRDKQRLKRGGGLERVTCSGIGDKASESNLELEALGEALDELQLLDSELHRIVELRVFGGMTIAEISTVTKASERTVERRWRGARAWLHARLAQNDE